MKSLEEKIIRYAAGYEDILLVYLFGSRATEHTHSESDVDVALMFRFNQIPSVEHLLQIQDDLTSLLGKEVDIVVLNNASPIIRMQVLRKGKKLFDRDKRAYIRFFVRTINEYDDLKRVRSVIEKKIARGRIYG
ncbi:MAG: nucleotidyltransferase domain-containing protein [Balneolaceae bacterium]|jgi:uncharacterized protein|nr:MAG: nucleotidyltransferase domain-containing protein [Balneolaceae bacterium]